MGWEFVIWTAFAVVLLVINLAVHEVAHLVALQRLGGEARQLGIGLPFWPRLVLKPNERRAYSISISPWIVGAYVLPTHESLHIIERHRYMCRAWFAGAGVVANMLMGGLLAATYALSKGNWLGVVVFLAGGALLWVGRKVIVAYVMVPAGLVALAAILIGIFAGPARPAGVVATAEMMVAGTYDTAMTLSITLSFILALANSMPLIPFDGGHVMGEALTGMFGPRTAELYIRWSSIAGLTLLAYLLLTDVFYLI